MELLKLNIQMFADGKVTIDTDLNKSGFESGLSKMQSIAKTGFKAIATSVGVASTAIAGLIAKSVTMAGDLQQQIGGTEAVFGEFASKVQEDSKKAYSTMGLSANDYMATINKMGSLMQGAGLDIETSMDLSSQAMQRASDVASVMGIDVNDAMEAVAGAAKGNFTMMDNLGVAMNATTIEAYAMSKGITTSYNEMDNATKVGLAMEMFLEKTQKYTGNYTKENKTFAGSFTTLKAATSNFLSGAGGIEEVSEALVNFGGILVESIGNMAPTIIEGLIGLTETLMPQIPVLLQSLMPSVLEGAVALINGLVAIFPALITMLQENLPTIVQGGMLIVQTLITSIINMLPQILQMGITLLLELVKGITQSLPELIPTMVTVIMDMVNILLDNIDLIIEAGIQLLIALTGGIMNALPELITRIPEIIIKIVGALFNLLPQILAAGIRLIVELGLGLIRGIPQLVIRIPEIIARMVSGLLEGVKDFANVGVNLVQGIWNGISNSYDWIKNKIKGWVGDVMDFLKKLFGIKSPSRLMRDEIGIYMAEGIGVGFEEGLGSVYDDMQRAIDFETEKMSANVQTSGTYQMAMAGLPTFNLTDNTENTTQLVVDGKVLAEVVNKENKDREVATA